jgi:hypothetical protein
VLAQAGLPWPHLAAPRKPQNARRTSASGPGTTLTTARRFTTARNSDNQHPARIEIDHAKYVPNSDGREPEPIVVQPAFLPAQDLCQWNMTWQ